MTVRQFLDTINTLLGGGSAAYTIAQMDPVATAVNVSFFAGAPSTFAQTQLSNGACPVWHNGDLVTYNQAAWGAGGVADATLLGNYFNVYAGTGGQFALGSTSGFTATWTDPTVLASYMPASGPASALDANLIDPTITSAGVFGGNVAALKLNVDFSDAGVLVGNVSLKFGDATLCNFSTLPALNGLSVRQFLGTVNTLLGGGSAAYSIAQLDPVTAELNAAFFAGTPDTFAQQQLVNGACP
jgi:hypothetical protein